MARVIESPGVQITEIDLSQNATLPVGTNVLVHGFAAQGPTMELVNVTSKSELEQIYGLPTTEAERYFYNSCGEILNSPAKLLVNRLPYGNGTGAGFGDTYTGLFYPVTGQLEGANTSYESSTAFKIGSPTLLNLTEEEYMDIKSGQVVWSTISNPTLSATNATPGNCGFIIVNKSKVSTDDIAQGYYVGIIDSFSANVSGSPQYDSIRAINTVNVNYPLGYTELSPDSLGSALTGTETSNPNSISEIMEKGWSYDFTNPAYNDSIIVALFRMGTSNTSQDENKIYIKYTEKYIGSLDQNDLERVNPKTLQKESFFVAKNINEASNYMEMYVNPNISKKAPWVGPGGTRVGNVSVPDESKEAFSFGRYISTRGVNTSKIIGLVPSKLEMALMLAENKDVVDVDIVCEAGLGTIYTYAKIDDENNPTDFNPEQNVQGEIEELQDPDTGVSCNAAQWYNNVYNQFATFCSETRKDCMMIADPLRGIFVQGDDFKIIQRKDKNFSQNIYWPLKNLYATANNNYVATYGNWVKSYDSATGDNKWMPFSGFQAAIIARMDANLQPWYAPAGLENGIVRNIVDIAINPTQKQRDLLYKVGINPVVFFPRDAYTVWGQKTLQAKPSAFDRINVRRLFLTLEKATLRLTRYFVMQPNTVFTRTRLVNYLKPIFDIAKQNEGVYDYLLVCDERNNTPDVIDNNELKLDIYIKPVRTAEFILVNFIATRTGADFNELIK